MELAMDTATQMWHTYNGFFKHADPRTSDWFMMEAYHPTLLLTMAYLLIVWIGPKFMADRPAYKLRYPVVIYNGILVVINFHIFYELIVCSTILGYSYSCQLVGDVDNPYEYRIAKALWWYYFSKCIEFMDTFFFILRKKNNQISFLHVYHHSTMFPIWWIGVKWVPGGQSFFGAMINSFIHVLMYTYYGVAALGPDFQKYLWWKKYLTRIQLVQFIAGMLHAMQSLYTGCLFPLWMQYALIFYGMSILSLFINFYYHAYIKSRQAKKATTNGVKNGFIQNGISNGKLESVKRLSKNTQEGKKEK